MKKLIIIFILFFFSFIDRTFCLETKTIVIAGDEEDIYTAPFKTPDGKRVDGICYAIIEQVAIGLGIKIEYRLMPFDKLLQEAKLGNVDAVMPVIKTKDRLEYLDYPENGIWVEESYLVTLKKYGINFSGDLADFKNYPIGVVKGYSYGNKFDAAVESKQIKTIEYPGYRAALDDLINGKIKITAVSKDTTEYLKRQLNIGDLIMLEPSLSKDMFYLAFSKKKRRHEELAACFSAGIEKFRRSEEFRKIFDYYGFHIPTVKIAADDRPPYYSPEMTDKGPITEIITQAFKRVAYKVNIDFLPWANVLEKVKSGKYDAGFAAYYSDQRAKEYLFSDPIDIYSPECFLKKKSLKISFKSLRDLKPYRIGITRGYVYDDSDFDKATYLKKIESNTEETNIANLIKGRLDIIIIDKAVALYLIDKKFPSNKNDLDFNDLDFIDPSNKKIDLHLLISKKFENSSQLKRDFDYGLQQIKADGTFDRIIKKYKKEYGYFNETNEN